MVDFVIGITGTIGSGKEVVRKFLEQNFSCYSVTLSSVILAHMKGKHDRKSLQDMGNELRKKYGNFILAKLATDYLQRDREMIIVDGIRNPGEVEYLRKTFGKKFFLIGIDAPRELRWNNIKSRGREGDPKTWEEFLAIDERDQGIGEPLYGQRVKECLEMADFFIYNSTTLEDLNQKLVEIVKKLKEKKNY